MFSVRHLLPIIKSSSINFLTVASSLTVSGDLNDTSDEKLKKNITPNWNFGPNTKNIKSVKNLIDKTIEYWGLNKNIYYYHSTSITLYYLIQISSVILTGYILSISLMSVHWTMAANFTHS